MGTSSPRSAGTSGAVNDSDPTGLYWHGTVMAPPRRPQAPRTGRFDVIVVGAGYTGLWTAIELVRSSPGMSVAIIEASQIGLGASGRNAGYLTPKFDNSLHAFVRNRGADAARRSTLATIAAIDAIEADVRESRIDCDFRRASTLIVSTHTDFDRRLERDLAAAEAAGVADMFVRLTPEELRGRVRSPLLTSGYEELGTGFVHPLKLVHGLADLAESLGIHLFERTPVRGIDVESHEVVVRHTTGKLHSDRVVLALNAWASHRRPFRRKVLPLYNYQAVTAPLTADDWAAVGWESGEGLLDRRTYLINVRPTPDGRIMIGGRDGLQPYAARIAAHHDHSQRITTLLRETFDALFPQLAHLPFEMEWGGPIAMTPNLLPQVGLGSGGRVAYSHGYCGHGLPQSRLCAQIVSDLLSGSSTERTALPFVQQDVHGFPPEPLRFLGGWATRTQSRWYDDTIQQGRRGDKEPFLLGLAMRMFG